MLRDLHLKRFGGLPSTGQHAGEVHCKAPCLPEAGCAVTLHAVKPARSAAGAGRAADTNFLTHRHSGYPAATARVPKATRPALPAARVCGKRTAVHVALSTHWQPGVGVLVHRTCRFDVRQSLITGVKKAPTGGA